LSATASTGERAPTILKHALRTAQPSPEVGLRPVASSLLKIAAPLSAQQQRLLSMLDAEEEGILFQHSVLCQTCLPYRNPGESHRRWTRKNGYLTLELDAGRAFDDTLEDFVDVGLPFGPKPRLVLYHLNAEALRTRSPVIELADTLTAFVKRTLGLDAHGRNILTVREQLTRLAASDFRIGKSEGGQSVTVHGRILNGLKLWTNPPDTKRVLWPTAVQFSAEYFESLLTHAVPLNEAAVGRLSHSAMALDIYTWLAQRLHRIEPNKNPLVSWASLCEQFGPGYAHVREFRRVFKHTLAQVQVVYPDARFELSTAGMHLKHSRPPVARRLLPVGSTLQM
jgi:Plasmid encoded RepA protein